MGQRLWGKKGGRSGAPQVFTKLESSNHLQKSNIIVHRFSGGELRVYDDGFNG